MDLAWRLRAKRIDEQSFTASAQDIAASYEGVSMTAEREESDCLSFFFEVPTEDAGTLEVEISIYDLSKDGLVLSLEADAADNHDAWEDASQIAEDLADALEGVLLDV